MSSLRMGSMGAEDRSELSSSQAEFRAGESYMISKDAEYWPVVICDEEIVQKYFKSRERPANARHADGTWGKDFTAGGDLAAQKCYPVLVPYTLKLYWLGCKALEVIDNDIGTAIQASTTTYSPLARAWKEAIKCEREGKDIEYWKERLATMNAAEKAQSCTGGIAELTKLESRKRKGTPKFKLPPGYTGDDGLDDDEGAGIFLPQADTEPKVKNEFSDFLTPTLMEANVFDEGGSSPYRKSRYDLNKRKKMDVAGRFSTKPVTPVKNEIQSRLPTPAASSNARFTPAHFKAENRHTDQTKVIIYVGNPHKKFRCKRSALNASPLLSELAVLHPGNGWYVMSPMLSTLKPGDFLPVGQYLERGEYDPNLLDEGTDWVRFERDLTESARGQEVVRCGTIYSTAQQLQLPKLQDLAFRKLRVLAKNRLHQPFAILCVIKSTFANGKEDLRQYLVHYLADNYWDIVIAETRKIAEVMQDDEDLARGVFGLLGGFDGSELANAQVEEEHHVKAEITEEMRAGPLSPESSQKKSPLTEGKGVLVDAGMSETEQKAFEAVMRDSDKAATEEEMTRAMREQSLFLQPY